MAGWVRSTDAAQLAVIAWIDGAATHATLARDVNDDELVQFRITLPRGIMAAELANKIVRVEARTTTESIMLELWQPIVVAAALDEMDSVMLERMLRSLTAERHNELARLMGKHIPAAANRSPDSSIYDDLMRWS